MNLHPTTRSVVKGLCLLSILVTQGSVLLAGIPEPETILYGRILAPVGDTECLLNQGELTWTVSGGPEGRPPIQYATQLEPLANGQFSYRLKIPHEVLAYDLEVSDGAVPLTGSGWHLQHLEIKVNGYPAVVLPPAENSLVTGQATRAATHRIDLEVQMPSIDSDGDGLPDWWEDQNGYDKWDPADGTLPGGGTGSGSGHTNGSSPFTFAQWRAQHFPGAAGDLDEFAQQDPDEDDLVNLVEYAFNLNPRFQDRLNSTTNLPRAEIVEDRLTVTFQPRRDAADLEYQVELSDDLRTWAAAAPSLEDVSLPVTSGLPEMVTLRERTSITDAPQRYVRVQVRLRP